MSATTRTLRLHGLEDRAVPSNTAPELTGVPEDALAYEGSTFTFAATATDPDQPTQTLTYSLGIGAPDRARIDQAGVFTWAVGEAADAESYRFAVRVSDGVETTTRELFLTVAEVNVAPTLAGVPAAVTLPEGAPFTFQVAGNDTDLPVQPLTYSLADAPAGATISETGAFHWAPTAGQGPGSYTFQIQVGDGLLITPEPITLVVLAGNRAPVLSGVPASAIVVPGETLSFTAVATDGDAGAELTFALAEGPAGATIDPTTGAFAWTPPPGTPPGTYPLRVAVSDGSATVSASAGLVVARAAVLNGDLVVAGTPGIDSIRVSGGTTGPLVVRIDGTVVGTFNPAAVPGRIVLRGYGGDDTLALDADVRVRAVLDGGSGADTLVGGGGDDTAFAGPGADVVVGNTGMDTLVGPTAEAVVWKVRNRNGSVAATRFSEINRFVGGAGADTFVFLPGGTVFGSVDGGGGVNALSYAAFTTPVLVNLGLGTATGVASVANVRDVTGGAGADLLVGDAGANRLTGAGGRDVLIGGAGMDVLDGGAGADLLIGGATTHDRWAAGLAGIRSEWASDRPAGTRAGHLLGNFRGGQNGPAFLNAAGLVNDQGEADVLTGGTGADWFLTAAADVAADQRPGERVTAG